MSGGPPMTFSMPMFRDFVPKNIRPWIFVIFAFCFQFSGGMYLGALNEIMSSRQLLREDVLMCLYCNLGGMAIYFPFLFRAKFRFTNKTLLMGAALGLIVCSFGAAYVTSLPLLWFICLVSGFCKLQGTFECMSNIQLWMTPKRDFRVFFPLLHIFILGAMQVSDYVTAHLAYTVGWEMMHWLVAGVFCCVALTIMILLRRVHVMPVLPLYGIDWVGALLWLASLLQFAFFFCYANTWDWFNSPVLQKVFVSAIVTLAVAVGRSFVVRHPYISPEIWKVKHMAPVIILIMIGEFVLGTEHVVEEVFYEEGLGYGNITTAQLDIWAFAGCIFGCLFSLVWMKVCNLSSFRLTTMGFFSVATYLIICYATVSTEFDFRGLRVPLFFRSFGYAVLSISLMNILNNIMTFQTFFMALSIFNMVHMIIGGVMGAAVYSYGLNYYMADFLSRYAEFFDHVSLSRSVLDFNEKMELMERGLMVMSVKEIYGWVAYLCVFVGVAMLLYKVPLVQKTYIRMQGWRDVGIRLRKRLKRQEVEG